MLSVLQTDYKMDRTKAPRTSPSLQRMAERMWSAPPPRRVEDPTIFAFSTWRPSVVGGDDTEPKNAWDKDGQPKQGKDSVVQDKTRKGISNSLQRDP